MTLLLIRHGSAGDPYLWSGDNRERPLDHAGTIQAERLVEVVNLLLAERPLAEIRSSPAVRCLQTVGPLGANHGLAPAPHEALFEGSSHAMTGLVRDLAALPSAPDRVVALCSHSDVIPDVIRDVVADGASLTGARGCAYASVWELTVGGGSIVHAQYRPQTYR